MSKLITVFGATGNQGGSVIRTIIADPELSKEFRIRAVTRDLSNPKAQALADQGIEVIQVWQNGVPNQFNFAHSDFFIKGDMRSHEDVTKAVDSAHTVYLMTNFWETMSAKPEILQGKIVTDACKDAGVKHLIFSSLINASKATEGRLVNITHFDGKAEVEEYIRESGVPASFVMLGIFMSELFSMIRKHEDGSFILPIPVSPRAVAPFVDPSADTGNFVRVALQHPPSDKANVIYASSDYYSFEKIAADFESVIGIPLKVVSLPGDMFKSALAASLPPDMVDEIYENLVLLEGPGYYAGANLTGILQSLSEKPVTVREFIEKNREHWV